MHLRTDIAADIIKALNSGNFIVITIRVPFRRNISGLTKVGNTAVIIVENDCISFHGDTFTAEDILTGEEFTVRLEEFIELSSFETEEDAILYKELMND